MRFLFALFIFVFIYPFAKAALLPLTGRIYTDQYLYTSSNRPRTLAESSVSLWLEADTKNDQGMGAKIVGQSDFFYRDVNHPSQASIEAKLREGYVSYLSEGSALRVGQQIIPWGKSDGINPTDYFTAKNYTLLNPDEEVRRVGAPAVNFSFTPEAGNSPLTFQLVFQAYYPQNKLLIPDQLIPPGISFQRNPKAPAAFQSDAMEYGFKIAYLKSDYDFSVSAFRGFSAFPEYRFNSTSLSIDAFNPEETALGGDASFTFHDYVVRFESALHIPDNGKDTDPLYGFVEPMHWDSVLGAEKPIFDDFRIQIQVLYRWHFNYRDDVTASDPSPLFRQIRLGVAKANATLLNYQRQGNPGATFRFSYAKETSAWTGDVLLIGYFSSGTDFVLRPQAGYSPREGMKLLAGLDLYGGDPNRTLGSLHAQSDAFFEAKYLF